MARINEIVDDRKRTLKKYEDQKEMESKNKENECTFKPRITVCVL